MYEKERIRVESLESRIERLEFYQQLLLETLDRENADFYKLIVGANLTKEEVNALYKLCEDLNVELQMQKAEGLVVFSPLLTQFAGLLHPNLNVERTIEVFLNKGMFIALMQEFKKVLNKNE